MRGKAPDGQRPSLALDCSPPEPPPTPAAFTGTTLNRFTTMPQGDKRAYTDKQKRKAMHIEESYEARGLSEETAKRRAWATVNKQDGGGKKSGSGRKQ